MLITLGDCQILSRSSKSQIPSRTMQLKHNFTQQQIKRVHPPLRWHTTCNRGQMVKMKESRTHGAYAKPDRTFGLKVYLKSFDSI